MKPSTRAKNLYAFIASFIHENHFGPIYEEMCDGIGLKSKSNLKPYLEKLKAARLIDYTDGVPRGIWLVGETTRPLRVPFWGSISAGAPIPQRDDEDADEYTSLTVDQLPKGTNPESLYALRVDGDSMMDANIQDGDLVIIDRHAPPREGDTLVFWLKDDSSTTLKRFYRDGDQVLLQPANPKYQTKAKHQENVESYGKVVQVIRNYAN